MFRREKTVPYTSFASSSLLSEALDMSFGTPLESPGESTAAFEEVLLPKVPGRGVQWRL